MKSISAEEFHKIKDEVLILDVRTDSEYQMLPKIPGSVNIHINDLFRDYEKFLANNSKPIIVTVCNAGNRSGEAADFLEDRGYNAMVLTGGIYGYKRKFKI